MTAPEVAVPSATPSAPAPAPTQPFEGKVEFTPSQPVVQATAPVEERIAAAKAAAEAEQAAASTAPRRAEARSTVLARTAQVAPAPRTTAAAPTAAGSASAAPAAAPEPSPITTQPQDGPAETPAPGTATSARTDQALLWALGGGALLLLGLGGTALARRRRLNEQDDVDYEPAVAPVPMAAQPVPAVRRPAMAPVSRSLSDDATLEKMVAAAPSAENPFRTRTKRLRRAQYLLAQREAAPAFASPPQTIHAEPAPTPDVDRSQTVYRFGNQPVRPGFLKPRTR